MSRRDRAGHALHPPGLPPLRRRPGGVERVCAELGESYDEVDIDDDAELQRPLRRGDPGDLRRRPAARLLAGRRGPAAGRPGHGRAHLTTPGRRWVISQCASRAAWSAGFVLTFTNSYSELAPAELTGLRPPSSGWREAAGDRTDPTDSCPGHPRGHRRATARLPAGPDHPRRRAAPRTCSSEELAAAAGVNSAKLRKDLSYLGSYGTRGVGYDVDYLRYQIAREIGVTQDWPVVIVGIGNLGHALANYSGFRSRGFRVVALLDADPSRHGEVVAGVDVRAFDDLEQIVARARRRASA